MFDEDNRGKPFEADPEYVLIQPAVTITVTCSDPSVTDPPIVLEFPERKLTREQVSPAWLALHDAEQRNDQQQGNNTK